jgi:hypothetical protein
MAQAIWCEFQGADQAGSKAREAGELAARLACFGCVSGRGAATQNECEGLRGAPTKGTGGTISMEIAQTKVRGSGAQIPQRQGRSLFSMDKVLMTQ